MLLRRQAVSAGDFLGVAQEAPQRRAELRGELVLLERKVPFQAPRV